MIVMTVNFWGGKNNVVKTFPEEKYINLWSYIYINIRCNIFIYV